MNHGIWTYEDGRFIDLTTTALIQSFMKYESIPEINSLLDWRNRVEQLRDAKNGVIGPVEDEWYQKELLAVDYLLNLKTNP